MGFGAEKEAMSVDLANKVANEIREMSQSSLSMENINLYCSFFESGQMRLPQNRAAGKILLQPLLEDNFGFMRNRCISGYITSVRDDAQAISELRDMLPPSCEDFVKYIDHLKEKSVLTTRKDYLKNNEMRFITTNIIDIDGTLDYGAGKLNQQLMGMIADNPDDDFAICTRRASSPQDRLLVCTNLINTCQEFLKNNPENKNVAGFMELLQTGRLKVYSKSDLMGNPNICLAGSITDDEMPEILGIQSLSDATVSTYHSKIDLPQELQPLWSAVPKDRKITLQQLTDEKMLETRMSYLQNSDMKFITTHLIDQSALLKERKLNRDVVKLLLKRDDDWAIVCFGRDKISRYLDSTDNDELLKGKIINLDVTKIDNICLVEPFVCSNMAFEIKSLTDTALSPLYKSAPLDPHVQEAYEKLPSARKMTINEYLCREAQSSAVIMAQANQR